VKTETWGKADLHIHSDHSDGLARIPDIMEYVQNRTDLDVIAITDHNTIEGALFATSWWRNTNSSQRQWQQLLSQDPAEAQASVQRQAAVISDRAKSLGIRMGPGEIANLATMVQANGWTSEQYIDALIGQVDWNNIEGGDLTASRDRIKAIGSEYLVGVSETTAQNYAMRIAAGELTEEGVASIMRDQAKGRFGWMASQLDQGVTVKQYLNPIRDVIARELGMEAEAVDIMDPKWLKLVEVRDEKGNMRAATLDEAQLAARKQPEWANSRNSQEMTTSMMTNLKQIFGR
jgi:hypothetical protein